MRAAIYSRVSSEEQVDGFSLSAQAELCQRHADFKGWTVVKVYEERGRSGKNAERPEFQQMIRDAQAKQFDVLIVHKLDRFSRSLLDTMSYLKLFNDLGITLVSVTEDWDFTTPTGKMMLGMIALLAQWYLDNLSMETQKGKRERARQGGWNGTLAFGYTNLKRLRRKLEELGNEFREGKIAEPEYASKARLIEDSLEQWASRHPTAAIPCPFNADGLRTAFAMHATGRYSDLEIAEFLNEAGYRTTGQRGPNPFSKDTVRDMLQNRFYLGETSYKARKRAKTSEETIPGNHPPLISEALFNRSQEIRALRADRWGRGSSNQVAFYPLASLLYCAECGTRWQGWFMKATRRYRDPAREQGVNCTQRKSAKADVLEEEARNILLNLALPSDWRDRVIETLKQGSPEQARLEEQYRSLSGQLQRLKRLYVLGDLPEEEYNRQRASIQAAMDAIPLGGEASLYEIEEAAKLLDDLPRLWSLASEQERAQLFRSVFHKLYVHEGRIKIIEPTRIMWALLSRVLPKDTPDGDDGQRGSVALLYIMIAFYGSHRILMPSVAPVNRWRRAEARALAHAA